MSQESLGRTRRPRPRMPFIAKLGLGLTLLFTIVAGALALVFAWGFVTDPVTIGPFFFTTAYLGVFAFLLFLVVWRVRRPLPLYLLVLAIAIVGLYELNSLGLIPVSILYAEQPVRALGSIFFMAIMFLLASLIVDFL